MLEVFKRILYGNRFENTTVNNASKKEENTMAKAKANANATVNLTTVKEEGKLKKAEGKTNATENKANAKEEPTMKATENKGKATTSTKANEKEKETMQKAKTNTKGKTTNNAKAKGENTMQKANELITATINGIEITGTQEQITAIILACANTGAVTTEPKQAKSKATATKGKATKGKTATKESKDNAKGKSSAKGTATETEPKKTWAEKKAEFASQFTDEERAEYGLRKRTEKAGQQFAFNFTKGSFKERVAKPEWDKAYKENLGFVNNAIEELFEEGKAYTEEEVVIEFFKTLDCVKKVRTDVKGYTKFVRA